MLLDNLILKYLSISADVVWRGNKLELYFLDQLNLELLSLLNWSTLIFWANHSIKITRRKVIRANY